jgi:hypothetical protein
MLNLMFHPDKIKNNENKQLYCFPVWLIGYHFFKSHHIHGHIHRCKHNITSKFTMFIELYLLNQSINRLTFFLKKRLFCEIFQLVYQDFQEVF